jgi:hypothetical protein
MGKRRPDECLLFLLSIPYLFPYPFKMGKKNLRRGR